MLDHYDMLMLKIDGKKTAADFRKEFNLAFPFLKVDFFKRIPSKKDSIKLTPVQPGTVLGNTEPMEITGGTSVKELREIIDSRLGFASLVYRKSGNIWIEISLTDDWSLDKQNHEAEQMN